VVVVVEVEVCGINGNAKTGCRVVVVTRTTRARQRATRWQALGVKEHVAVAVAVARRQKRLDRLSGGTRAGAFGVW
jgi:hypothetical protein